MGNLQHGKTFPSGITATKQLKKSVDKKRYLIFDISNVVLPDFLFSHEHLSSVFFHIAGQDPSKAFKKKRKVYLPIKKRFQGVPVCDGDRLRYGNKIEGPAIIEQVNTTTFVSPEFSVVCDAYGSFTLYLKSREKEFKRRVIS